VIAAASFSLILRNQPLPEGSSLTSPGESVSALLTSTTLPDTGALTSLAALTLSTVAASAPLDKLWPIGGSSTNTTSPNWDCA